MRRIQVENIVKVSPCLGEVSRTNGNHAGCFIIENRNGIFIEPDLHLLLRRIEIVLDKIVVILMDKTVGIKELALAMASMDKALGLSMDKIV